MSFNILSEFTVDIFCAVEQFFWDVSVILGGTLATGFLLLQGESMHPNDSDMIQNKQVRVTHGHSHSGLPLTASGSYLHIVKKMKAKKITSILNLSLSHANRLYAI